MRVAALLAVISLVAACAGARPAPAEVSVGPAAPEAGAPEPPRDSCSSGPSTYEAAVADFVARAAVHIRRFFPERVASLADAALDARIREGIRRAARHGIVNERDVVKYIDVWITFGDGFEAMPWAAAILTDTSLSPTQRTEALMAAAIEREKR